MCNNKTKKIYIYSSNKEDEKFFGVKRAVSERGNAV
jgi:hypothetical protein